MQPQMAVKKPQTESSSYLLLCFILGLLAMMGPISIDILLPILPAMASGLTVTISHIEFTMTAIFAGSAFGQILYGPISDRLGRKTVILSSLFLYILTVLILSLSASFILVFILRFIQGLLMASGRIIANAAARDLFEGKQLARLISTIYFISIAASIVTPILGSFIESRIGWRGVFYFMALYGIISFFFVLWGLRETIRKKDPKAINFSQVKSKINLALKNSNFKTCLFSGGFSICAIVAYLSASPGVAKSVMGLSPQEYSYYFGFVALLILLGAQTSNYLSKSFSLHSLIILGGIVQILGAVGIILVTIIAPIKPMLFFGCIGISMIGFSFVFPLTTAKALNPFPEMAGTISSFLGFIQSLMGAATSGFLALLFDGTSIPLCIFMASSCFLSTGIYILYGVKESDNNLIT